MDEKQESPPATAAPTKKDELAGATAPANRKVVRLLRSIAPPGSGAVVAGTLHIVSDEGTIEVDANLSDETLAKELGQAYVKA